MTFILTEKEVLRKPVLYLSHFFKRHRAEYYTRLQAVRDHGDWETWLAFFLRGVASVSDEAAATAGRILAMREDHREAIADQLGRAAGSGLRLLERLYDRPIMSVQDAQEVTGTTFAATNNVISQLVAAGILREITGQARNRRFMYADYVALFD